MYLKYYVGKKNEGRTISRALWHLQVECLALVVFPHFVVDRIRGLATEQAAGVGEKGTCGCGWEFAAGKSVSQSVLEERGADEVGWNEAH